MINLKLEDLRLDGGTQPRASLNYDIIDDYSEDMVKGDNFPALDVFYDGTDYWLADGFHRYHAAVKAGLSEIQCTVHQGVREDAVLFSCGVNASHGFRRTNSDKKIAIATAYKILLERNGKPPTQKEIAQICKLTESMVSRVLNKSEGAEKLQLQEIRTLKSQQEEADKLLIEHPNLSNREIARRTGLDDKTVGKLRKLIEEKKENDALILQQSKQLDLFSERNESVIAKEMHLKIKEEELAKKEEELAKEKALAEERIQIEAEIKANELLAIELKKKQEELDKVEQYIEARVKALAEEKLIAMTFTKEHELKSKEEVLDKKIEEAEEAQKVKADYEKKKADLDKKIKQVKDAKKQLEKGLEKTNQLANQLSSNNQWLDSLEVFTKKINEQSGELMHLLRTFIEPTFTPTESNRAQIIINGFIASRDAFYQAVQAFDEKINQYQIAIKESPNYDVSDIEEILTVDVEVVEE